jgi:hypothetical protein
MTHHRLGTCLLALGLVVAMPAAAQPKKDVPPGKEVRDEKHERNEARKDLKEEQKDLRDAVRAGADSGALAEARKDVAAAREQLRAAEAKARLTRGERRRAHGEEHRKKWGKLLDDGEGQREMRVHAERMAKMRRIEDVAKAEGKGEIEKRVKELIEKEDARHEKRMTELGAKLKEATP